MGLRRVGRVGNGPLKVVDSVGKFALRHQQAAVIDAHDDVLRRFLHQLLVKIGRKLGLVGFKIEILHPLLDIKILGCHRKAPTVLRQRAVGVLALEIEVADRGGHLGRLGKLIAQFVENARGFVLFALGRKHRRPLNIEHGSFGIFRNAILQNLLGLRVLVLEPIEIRQIDIGLGRLRVDAHGLLQMLLGVGRTIQA